MSMKRKRDERMMQIDLSLEAAEDEERAVEEDEDGGRREQDVVDRSRKDYYELQMRFRDIQQREQLKVSLSLGAESGQAPKMVVADQGMDSDDATELSLSLSLQTHADPHKRVDARAEKGKGFEKFGTTPGCGHDHITSHSTNPATRRTRVSVRSRCQGPTRKPKPPFFTCYPKFILCIRANPLTPRDLTDERWVPMEKVWAEGCEGESMSESLLSVHGHTGMPGQEAGAAMPRRHVDTALTWRTLLHIYQPWTALETSTSYSSSIFGEGISHGYYPHWSNFGIKEWGKYQ
ncbi:hypothetical protein OPV22_022078 [Ensete ventricosum]|uniref:Uncharacterized protein n=1 Tax=Ensete ventricosum TaxID=4639 RepID=A0AAV8PDS4_ENSVE|nr:hypothetical protein OPV22_022078 [Ensete ventricosum]